MLRPYAYRAVLSGPSFRMGTPGRDAVARVRELGLRVRHSPDTRTRHQFRVLREHSGGVTRCGWLPPRTPLRQLAVADVELEHAPVGVDRDRVPVFDERDGAAHRRLGSDVAHHHPVGPEAAVGGTIALVEDGDS